jgi:hypothetical protein
MTPTSNSSTTDSPAGSYPPEPLPAPGGVCAIHQPNLFPRLNTLAKLYNADYWIVLNDVQFSRRDYQHRTRLSDPAQPERQQWLSLSVHLPQGRSTSIRDVRIVDARRCRRRTEQMIRERYRRHRHWHTFEPALQRILDLFDTTDRVADIAEESTRAMLSALNWQGTILHSSHHEARPERNYRLVDLAVATGAGTYICGTGGAKYLDPGLFREHDVAVTFHRIPADGIWTQSRNITALQLLTTYGGSELARAIRAARSPGVTGSWTRARHDCT